jgi:hypothetical protein
VNTGKVERKCDLSEKPLLNTGRLQLRGGMLKPTSAFTLRCTPPLRSKTLQPEMSGKVDCRSCRAIA